MKLNKILKRTAAVLCAAVLLCPNIALAATEETENKNLPDLVFYRAKATNTFEGEIDIRGGSGSVTDVAAEGDSPALYISEWDDNLAYFDSLYKSAEQTLTVTRGGEEYEVVSKLAVYDRVELEKATGSVTLTVKDNRTLKPVAGAEYSLYKDGKAVEKSLVSDSSGKITVRELAPGEYELRQLSSADGYEQTTAPVGFTIGGIEISGGEYQIRTSAGKKITADENEVFIAGEFSPDVELAATKEEQITLVTVTVENFGAELEQAGKTKQQKFSTAEEAEDFINTEKNENGLCGAVSVSYTLKGSEGKSTCNFVQYVEAKAEPAPTLTPTPVPTPSVNQSQSSSSAPQVNPISTPAPTAVPKENLTICATSDDNVRKGFAFEITGVTAEGASYVKNYETDSSGQIELIVPTGVYTITPSASANKGYSLPEAQSAQISADGSAYLTFAFARVERDLELTVLDDDGIPVEGVTVGVFSADMLIYAGTVRDEDSGRIDVSQKIVDVTEKEEYEKLLENPYEKKNAIATAKSDKNGCVTISGMANEKLLIVPLSAPDGYSEEISVTEIPAGLENEFDILVEYVKVNFTVENEITGEVPYDTLATLLDDDEKELAGFTVDGQMHTLIRVPSGHYTLRLSYNGETDDLNFDIDQSRSVYNKEVVTKLEGNIEKEEEQSSNVLYTVIFCLLSAAAAAAIAFVTVTLVKRIRQKKGAIK